MAEFPAKTSLEGISHHKETHAHTIQPLVNFQICKKKK